MEPKLIAGAILLSLISLSAPSLARHSSLSENKGQVRDQFFKARPDIQYSMSAGDVTMFVGNGQLHYQWYKSSLSGNGQQLSMEQRKNEKIEIYRMDVVLLGANTEATVVAEGRSKDYETYYQPYLPTGGTTAYGYNKVTYKNVYPNIDWVLYTNNGGLKYDFIVHPGGKVSDIKLQYNGGSAATAADGSVTATTPFGSITEQRPYSYNAETKQTVPSSFVLQGNTLSFDVSAYSGTLVIDPEVNWITYYGGSQASVGVIESIFEVESDSTGNVYVAGTTGSSNNIATTGAYQATLGGVADAFVAKFNAQGVRQWGTYFGGTDGDAGGGIGIDASGNSYIAGTTGSTGLATPGAHKTTPDDIFIAKFNSSGSREWCTYYDGTAPDVRVPVTCDHSGNVYIAHSNAGLLKMTSAGVYNWDNYMVSASLAGDLVCDKDDNIYWAGSTNALGFPQAYVRKNSSSGAHAWTVTYGGTAHERGEGVAVDTAGNVYLSGMTASFTDIATPGAHRTVRVPNAPTSIFDGFVVKLNSSGVVQWGSYYGYNNSQWGYDVAVTPTGKLFHSGVGSYSGGAYLIEIDPATSAVIDTISVNAPYGFSNSMSLSPSASGNLYATSWTQGATGVATPGAHQTTIGGTSDPVIFSFKVDSVAEVKVPIVVSGQQPVTLFPNPNGGDFTLSGLNSHKDIEITDVTGKLVYRSAIKPGTTEMKLNLGKELASGNYLLRLSSASKTEVLKFTIGK